MAMISLLWSLAAVLTMIAMASADDKAALLAFRARLSLSGSPPTLPLASWNDSAHFCSWEGVACSHRRRPARVVALRLNGTGLTGPLSQALGNLTFLRTLDLSSNWLNGEIPASLGRLHLLQRLYLNNNTFSGMFPANLSSCVSMTIMRLHRNNLGGRIPPDLGEKLMSLTEISLGDNSFTGPIPASLANLSYLQDLHLPFNQLVGMIPPGLGNIKSMLQLILFGNNLSEYGEGSAVSTHGDIYSLGILLLEMFTGRSPTDEKFRDSLGLHKFAEHALPDRTMEIADPTMWLHTEPKDDIKGSRIQECLVSVIRLGISC